MTTSQLEETEVSVTSVIGSGSIIIYSQTYITHVMYLMYLRGEITL